MAVDGATLRYVVYDILKDFKQVLPDADISEYQMTYWVLVHADRLKKQHIQKIDSGEYVHAFDLTLNESNGRKYITLPNRIYDYDLDKGIAYICYIEQLVPPGEDPTPGFVGLNFSRTTPGAAPRLSFRTEETPSVTKPYFYRINNNIYFLGIDDYTGDELEVGLYTTLDPTDLDMDIDAPFDFPQDLIPTLKRQILDMGSFVLQIPKDLVNDGANIKGEMPQKKFTSVSDFNTNDN